MADLDGPSAAKRRKLLIESKEAEEQPLRCRWVVVTGGGSGIGRSVVVQLSQRGNLNVMAVGRTKEKLDKTKELGNSDKIFSVTADVGTSEGRNAIKSALPSDAKGIILVHNAAAFKEHRMTDISEMEWNNVLQVNLNAPMFLSQTLLPHLENGGRILHVSSGRSRSASPFFSSYCVSKAGLSMLSDCMKLEFAELGIAVGCVEPGLANTPLLCNWLDEPRFDSQLLQQVKKLKSDGMIAEPRDVGVYIVHLLLDIDAKRYSSERWMFADTTKQIAVQESS